MDLLQRAGWVKRALFLADRVSLVNQAVGRVQSASAGVQSGEPGDREGHRRAGSTSATYPTMMGLIDETRSGNEARFSVGHFDLVIIDEAHRSVYQKYGAIFRYFDSLLVGLTATPTGAGGPEYLRSSSTWSRACRLMPTSWRPRWRTDFWCRRACSRWIVKFPREGIDYDSLSDEEKEQWESFDWGDDVDENGLPDRVNATAINSWLFNKDTVDKVLQHLMEQGHTGRRVETGWPRRSSSPATTTHAKFIEERFNHHYPQLQGTLRPNHRSLRQRIRKACSTTSRRRARHRTSRSRWICSTPASTYPRWRTWSSSSRSTRRSSSGR